MLTYNNLSGIAPSVSATLNSFQAPKAASIVRSALDTQVALCRPQRRFGCLYRSGFYAAKLEAHVKFQGCRQT
jgi:hypothetical protein